MLLRRTLEILGVDPVLLRLDLDHSSDKGSQQCSRTIKAKIPLIRIVLRVVAICHPGGLVLGISWGNASTEAEGPQESVVQNGMKQM